MLTLQGVSENRVVLSLLGEVAAQARASEHFGRYCWLCLWVSLLILATGCRQTRPQVAVVRAGRTLQVAEESPASPALSLITFNVHGLPCWFTGRTVGRYERLAGEIQRLNPDFVLLQEVWMRSALDSIPVDEDWTVVSDGMPFFFSRRNGLLVLSRYPIVSGQFRPFHAGKLPDTFVSKGVLKVTADLGSGRYVNIWNLHLQAGSAEGIRLDQLEELKRWLEESSDGQIADLVAGDFNFSPDSVEYRFAAGFLGEDVLVKARQPHLATYDGGGEGSADGRTLDYIFVSGPLKGYSLSARTELVFAGESEGERFSDHLGLRAVLSLDARLHELAGLKNMGSGGVMGLPAGAFKAAP